MENKLNIKATPVFDTNWEAVQSGKYRYIINQGGSRSSKTISLILVAYLLSMSGTYRGTVWREKRTWAKATVYNDMITWFQNWGVYDPRGHNKSDLLFRVGTSTIEFNGLDDYQKVHGLTQDWTWFNEGMEISKKEFDQIDQRTSKLVLIDFNPTMDEHWIYDLAKLPNAIVITSTMLDNPFLPEAIRNKILSYEPTPENIKLGTADKYNWTVYGLGKKARKEGLVFDRWEMVKTVPDGAKFIANGLDFGFVNDVTADIDVFQLGGNLYFDELFYETGLLNISISGSKYHSIEERFNQFQFGKKEVIADSAEQKSIAELKAKGFNVNGVKKGPGSINEGIDILKRYKIYITERSVNLKKENENYSWKIDFATGKALNVPIDDFNHGIDAVRYVALKKLMAKRKGGFGKSRMV